jgi:hypothetical protein
MPSRGDGVNFTVTGLHKSGNTWLNRLVGDLFGGNQTPYPMRLDWIARFPNDKYGISTQKVAECLLSGGRVPAGIPASQEQHVRQDVMDLASFLCLQLAREQRLERGVTTSTVAGELSTLLVGDQSPPAESARPTCGCPAKHVPLRNLLETFPDFSAILITRDPRDCLMKVLERFKVDFFCRKRPLLSRAIHRCAYAVRDDWLVRYLQDRRWHQTAFYDESLPFFDDDRVLVLRYEDLIEDARPAMARAAEFLGVRRTPDEIDAVVCRYDRRKLGKTAENPRSFLRSGTHGEWREYFDVAWRDALGDEYRQLLRNLGYESDDSWWDALPRNAPKQLDFSHFSLSSSIVYSFQDVWRKDEELQNRFPSLFAKTAEGGETASLSSWLLNHPDGEIREWLRRVRFLSSQWGVVGDYARDSGSSVMGY